MAFNYSSPVFLMDQSVNTFQEMGRLIESTLKEHGNKVPYRPNNYYQFASATITQPGMAKMLLKTTEYSRGTCLISSCFNLIQWWN